MYIQAAAWITGLDPDRYTMPRQSRNESPIQRLPFELLSEIFIYASQDEDLAPVTITEVCSHWRSAVLATPRAWSFIYLSNEAHWNYLPEYLSTFIRRSDPCLLHLQIPNHREPQMLDCVKDTMRAHPHRIQCISIGYQDLERLNEVIAFSTLRRLHITSYGHQITPSFISRLLYPRLQYIDSPLCSWLLPPTPAWFPPLRHLAIQTDRGRSWVTGIRSCAPSLKSLEIRGQLIGYETAPTVTIYLPMLEHISIEHEEGGSGGAPFPFIARTPALISYDEFARELPSQAPLLGDVSRVTHLRSRCFPHLTEFPALQVLQIRFYGTRRSLQLASALVGLLEMDLNICPTLRAIEYSVPSNAEPEPGGSWVSVKNELEKLCTSRPCLEILLVDQWPKRMPGSRQDVWCGNDMPCCN